MSDTQAVRRVEGAVSPIRRIAIGSALSVELQEPLSGRWVQNAPVDGG